MIKSIHIKNYRSHKDTFIDFSQLVNSVTGANDAGKTNILRAITTVIKNRPTGDDFISHWGGDMEVGIEVDDKIIMRYKDVIKDKKTGGFKAGGKNFYILIDKSDQTKKQIDEDYKKAIKGSKSTGCVKIFKAFGQGIPDEIKEALNMTDINVAAQFSGPFLLTKSASDTAKFYNSIVNLDIIDSSIRNIKNVLKAEERELKTKETKRDEKEEELKKFDWINDAEKEIKKIESIQSRIKRLKDSWTKLFKLNTELNKLNTEIDSINKITEHEKDIHELILLNAEIEKKDILFTDLEDLDNKLKYLITKNEKLDKIAQHEKGIDELIESSDGIKLLNAKTVILKNLNDKITEFKNKEKNIRKIIKHKGDIDKLILIDAEIKNETDKYNELFDLSESLDKLYTERDELKANQIKAENELNELMPEICPLCENEIK